MCGAPFVFLITLHQVALELVAMYDINISKKGKKIMTYKNFEHDVASDYPCGFTHGDSEAMKEWALRKAQKHTSMENIRIHAVPIINEIKNLLDMFDKEKNPFMFCRTLQLQATIESYISDCEHEKNREAENIGLHGFRW